MLIIETDRLPAPRVGDSVKTGVVLSIRRPITDDERPYLLALGAELKSLRGMSGLTRYQLAFDSLLSMSHLIDLFYGRRRTRRSTLTRIVDALVAANPALGPAQVLHERLCELAGPGLAPESTYPDTVARTLRRRARKRERGTWIA
jgi:hypothetical protein